jgi:hypothetical protein
MIALCSEIMEGTWGRQPTGHCLENDMAHSQA